MHWLCQVLGLCCTGLFLGLACTSPAPVTGCTTQQSRCIIPKVDPASFRASASPGYPSGSGKFVQDFTDFKILAVPTVTLSLLHLLLLNSSYHRILFICFASKAASKGSLETGRKRGRRVPDLCSRRKGALACTGTNWLNLGFDPVFLLSLWVSLDSSAGAEFHPWNSCEGPRGSCHSMGMPGCSSSCW